MAGLFRNGRNKIRGVNEMILETGTVVNNIYRVVKLLGSGSMGNVYLVERIKDDKKFVIKELMFSSQAGLDPSTAKEIFFREAEFIAKFDHRGLPKMYGVFSQDGREYLTMDYIEGKTLEEIINSGKEPLAEEQALKWCIELADILDYLHNSFHSPIVYRDLKPSNIIITVDNKAVLVDFGIARYYNPDKNTDTFSYGSPGYAAPEQYKGRGQSSPQTDIFGLGVILFQLLTKYDPTLKPFTFPDMKSLNPSISGKLANIVLKAIKLEPLKRYISVLEFKEALGKYSGYTITQEKRPVLPVAKASSGSRISMFYCTIILFLTGLFFDIIFKLPGMFTFSFLFFGAIIFAIQGLIYIVYYLFGKRYVSSLTLIELFIVIAIVLIIMAILVPSFWAARSQGLFFACKSNMKNIANALEIYKEDNRGCYPSNLDKLVKDKYMRKIPVCPAVTGRNNNLWYKVMLNTVDPNGYYYSCSRNFDSYTLICKPPDIHKRSTYNEGSWPQYTSRKGFIDSHW
jgi:tRNA A-37 threonylcarbamoyl transferase component Bud32/type II secretory pathway pseudopilin PulG